MDPNTPHKYWSLHRALAAFSPSLPHLSSFAAQIECPSVSAVRVLAPTFALPRSGAVLFGVSPARLFLLALITEATSV